MKMYAIRDRMLDYFIIPANFAPSDTAAQASLADLVNGESKNAITQAPHHFELWRLADINADTGDVNPSKEFIADCSSLIRNRIRDTEPERGRDNQAGRPALRSPSTPERTSGAAGADPSPVPQPAQGKAGE